MVTVNQNKTSGQDTTLDSHNSRHICFPVEAIRSLNFPTVLLIAKGHICEYNETKITAKTHTPYDRLPFCAQVRGVAADFKTGYATLSRN